MFGTSSPCIDQAVCGQWPTSSAWHIFSDTAVGKAVLLTHLPREQSEAPGEVTGEGPRRCELPSMDFFDGGVERTSFNWGSRKSWSVSSVNSTVFVGEKGVERLD